MHIYTDGGIDRNGEADAIGAWAFVADDGHEASGVEHGTTNNRAELLAVIRAVEYARGRGAVNITIHTDSQVTMHCATGRYKRKANLDLWAEYDHARAGASVGFVWVRGHSGVAGNERADELCSIAIADAQPSPELAHLRSIGSGGCMNVQHRV